jgi:hypothetical protein
MSLVRRFQTGPRGALTQKLLNELAAARVCLHNQESKAAYDAALGNQLSAHEAQRRMTAMRASLDASQPTAVEPLVQTRSHARQGAGRRSTPATLRGMALLFSALIVGLLAIAGWLLVGSSSGGRRDVPKGPPQRLPPAIAKDAEPSRAIEPQANGEIDFPPHLARLNGEATRQEIAGNDTLTFTSSNDSATWELHIGKPRFFQAELTYATKGNAEDAELELRIGERFKRFTLRSSGGMDQFISDAVTIAVPQSGKQKFVVRLATKGGGQSIVLKAVRFIPISAKLTPASP